jgi:hypothetical protein
MAAVHVQQLPPPKNWQDFEALCRDLWAEIWGDPNTQANGRSGQAQHGVDISGRPGGGHHWAGVQCKGKARSYGTTVSVAELRTEVVNAHQFKPPLSEFIIATSGPKDTKVEEEARALTVQNSASGLFSVHVWGWDDVVQALCRYPTLLDKHYPNLGPTLHSIAQTVATIDARLARSPDAHERVVALHRTRLDAIMRGEAASGIGQSATLVLHLLPLTPGRFDLTALSAATDLMPRVAYVHWTKRFNHDGLVSYWPEANPRVKYLSIWKTGGIELIDTYALQRRFEKSIVYALHLERDVVQFVEHWLEHVLKPVSIPLAHAVCMSVFGVHDFEIHQPERAPFDRRWSFDRDVITLSPALLGPESSNVRRALRPAFDEFWQAAGKERSPGYRANGDWDDDAHPHR